MESLTECLTETLKAFDISSYAISGNIVGYTLILLLFCIEYFIFYSFVKKINPEMTEKQKAYIISIKNALVMFLIGLYYNNYYFISKLNEESFFNILEEKDSINLGKVIVLYFTAYLIMDVLIGRQEYHKYMNTLSGYFHHTVYIIINIVSLYIGVYPLYLLHMLSELPTFLLGIGSFDPDFRNDDLFGATFFLTRIAYHLFLTYIFRQHTLLFYISLAALGLHCFWFSQWIKKYFTVKDEPNKNDSKNNKKLKNKKKSSKNEHANKVLKKNKIRIKKDE
jgi:hypothetical protein